MLTLDKAPIRQSVRMLRFHHEAPGFRLKLLAMGLTPGVMLEVLRVAPLGDPLQILLRGSVLSLRKKECQLIEIEDSKCHHLASDYALCSHCTCR